MKLLALLLGQYLLLADCSALAWAVNSAPVDKDLRLFLNGVNQRLAELYNREVIASWQREIKGPNDVVALLQAEIADDEIMEFVKSIASQVEKYKRLRIDDPQLRRQLERMPNPGYEALGVKELEMMYGATANMSNIYKKAKLCSFREPEHCNLTLIPEVQNIVHQSESVEEIEYYWLEWRRKTGAAVRDDFDLFIQLYRKTAKLNGFSKPSDYWFRDLEENSVEAMKLLHGIMLELRPLYQQFHAYVRAKLRQTYGPKLVPLSAPVPHNLGEIFIGNAFRYTEADWQVKLPYPNVGLPNLTDALLAHDLNNPQRVFWNVDEFFRSIGLAQLEPEFFTENARPSANISEDEEYCWNKAWKFYGVHRLNFSYCPVVNEEKFLDMFEAISDIYYIRSYQDVGKQPTVFSEEPFPNFSDAVGKCFSMAATSPRYLEHMQLIEVDKYTSREARINHLYLQGLQTIFLIPVFYVLDRYRVELLDGTVNVADNCAYWELTELYMGAEPPVQRSNKDFDAPAKLLMEVDDEYTSHILSVVLQYQLFAHFCHITGQYEIDDPEKPLDLCDLSNHTEIGPIVLSGMSMGSSRPYKEVLQVLTNQTELSLNGLLAYFQPLYDWLLEENRKHHNEVGWEKSDRCTP